MKKTLLLMALLATGTIAHASETNDTTVVEKPDKVMIMTSDTAQKVTVMGRQGDESYRYDQSVPLDRYKMRKRQERKHDDPHDWDFDFGLGVNIPINAPSEVRLQTFNSWEFFFGFRYCYTPKGRLQTYSAGLWLDWRNYGLKDSQCFVKDDNNVIDVQDFPSSWSNCHSYISVFSLSVPLLFTQKFGRDSKCSISLGPVVNFNVYGRLKNQYENGDADYDISVKNVGYRPVTIDLMGSFKYSWISLYLKYAPMNVLKKDRGPQFRSLTVGLYL